MKRVNRRAMLKGTIYGGTDDYGYRAVENRLEIHDMHATMLHLLGVDHTRLTSIGIKPTGALLKVIVSPLAMFTFMLPVVST